MDQTRNHFQRNSSWNAPYTFSGKEKDAETGYGYVKKLRFFSSLAFGNEKQVFHYAHCLRRFGARYYDSGLSIWLSVDPMSDKYPSMSPYNYCANNPVILVDPDGREIVDADGRICYTKQDGWLSNAPDDTKRVGNAMMETETGKEQFNKMVDADTQFQIKISQDKTGTKNGDMNPTSYHSDQNGNIILESATITIFINDIDEYINGIFPPSRIWDNSEEGMLAKYVNVSQFMGAVAGHEAEHGTSQENLQMNARKDPKLEIKPDEIKIKILKEYKYKNYGL